jgi:hypothetical protein
MNQLTITDVNGAILYGNFTNTELNSIIDAVKYARSRITEQAKRNLRIGDQVSFTSSKTGRVMQGKVTKVAIKYVTVSTLQGMWKVPANMLTKVTEKEFA